MIRDEKMMKLVAKNKEPITPFVQKVRSLYTEFGISTILVIGGSGDYFDVADHVIMMDCYRCHDVTSRAKAIAAENPLRPPAVPGFGGTTPRRLVGGAMRTEGKVVTRSRSTVQWGDVELDLSGLEQVASVGQTEAISQWMAVLSEGGTAGQPPALLAEAVATVSRQVDAGGLEVLAPGQFHGGLTRPRGIEVAAAINRLRVERHLIQK